MTATTGYAAARAGAESGERLRAESGERLRAESVSLGTAVS
ncbi:hypothetical protein [Kitasatospora sp. NE20-6]